MKKPGLIFVVFAIALVMIIQSCGREGGNSTNVSQTGGTSSHKTGQNCMNCHCSGGEGSGWFNAAGTVYTADSSSTYANVVVKLYTAPDSLGNQVLVTTINGDAKGNFYTTASINFGSGLYPVVVGAHGTKYMTATITQGACNGCHGVTTGRLYTN